jgi:predicted ArsR family transcriptional regulator
MSSGSLTAKHAEIEQRIADWLARQSVAMLDGQVAKGLGISRIAARKGLERLLESGRIRAEPHHCIKAVFTAYRSL